MSECQFGYLTMPTTSSHLLGLKLGQVLNLTDGGGGGGSSGGTTGRSCGRGAASKATGTLAPKPEPLCGRRNSKAQDPARKEVLGYAAVAAVRRSFEQQAAAVERMQPRPGRVWLSSGGRGPNGSRPASQPLPSRGLRPRLYGSPPRASTAGDGGRPVRTGSGSVASVACSFDSMASATALEDGNGNGSVHAKEFPRPPSMLVFSGGTAFNGVVEELKKLTTNITHVLPVSDDGGSTSEILRVLGGPALGDIRSRCLRLSDESSAEALAVKRLLGYRLPLNAVEAKAEWYNIVEGEHGLWNDVSGPYRETIRAFLVFFQTQILMHSNEKFCFSNGSIGNFFFAGARIFFQSLDAAIFLYSRVSAIPVDSIVLPVICTNDRLTLGCELYDGTFLRGQNEISHPVKRDLLDDSESSQVVDKGSSSTPPLPSPIKRIFYMSTNGINASHEVFPPVNTRVLERIIEVDAIIYGMGSLYTSICPLLVLRGVGEAIAKQTCPKLLLLNGTHDRETSGMSASDFIISICDALNRKYGDPKSTLDYPPTAYVNVVLVPKNGGIPVDTNQLAALGINQVVVVDSMQDERSGTIFDPKSLIACLDYAISCYLKSDSEPLDKRKISPTRLT